MPAKSKLNSTMFGQQISQHNSNAKNTQHERHHRNYHSKYPKRLVIAKKVVFNVFELYAMFITLVNVD